MDINQILLSVILKLKEEDCCSLNISNFNKRELNEIITYFNSNDIKYFKDIKENVLHCAMNDYCLSGMRMIISMGYWDYSKIKIVC